MKILCISDHIDPLVYSNQIKSRFSDVDAIVSSGDLPLNYYDFIVSSLNKPLYFIFGNHNLKKMHLYRKIRENTVEYAAENLKPISEYVGATYAGGRIKRENGLIVGGLGGSMWYNGGKNQYTNKRMYMKALRLVPGLIWNRIFHHRFIDILITHAPPCGIHDQSDRCHAGFKAFLWFMKTFKPKYLIHGHVHLYDLNTPRTAEYYDTTVINAYNHYLIDLELRHER